MLKDTPLTIAPDEDGDTWLTIAGDGGVVEFICPCDMGQPNVHFHYERTSRSLWNQPEFAEDFYRARMIDDEDGGYFVHPTCRVGNWDIIYMHIAYGQPGDEFWLQLGYHAVASGAFYFPEDWGMPPNTVTGRRLEVPWHRKRGATWHLRDGSQDLYALQQHVQQVLENVGCSERLLIRAHWNRPPDADGFAIFTAGHGFQGLAYDNYSPPADAERRYGFYGKRASDWLCAQGGLCAVCQQPAPAYYWRIDHVDTAKGPEVRGILCNRCNTRLGKYGDTPDKIREWLKANPNSQELKQMFAYLERGSGWISHINGGQYPVKVTPVTRYRDKDGNIISEHRHKRKWKTRM